MRAAHAVIAPRVHRTPVLTSRTLGPAVWLKAELFQRTGSFKFRGALHRVSLLGGEGRAVKTMSAGNHAQAVALACREARVECQVFMPDTADAQKVAATRAYGAQVTQSPDFVALAQAAEGVMVHPFDDPAVMAGAGTVALELLEQAPEIDTLLVPVSGGGLLSGMCAARQGRKVVAVESSARPGLTAELAGRPRPSPRPTIADGLTAPYLGRNCMEVIREHVDSVITVSEEEIADGFRFLHGRAKLAAEASGSVATAALLSGRYAPERGEGVGVVVSGGNVAPGTAASLLAG